jgi:hypothetical protein
MKKKRAIAAPLSTRLITGTSRLDAKLIFSCDGSFASLLNFPLKGDFNLKFSKLPILGDLGGEESVTFKN